MARIKKTSAAFGLEPRDSAHYLANHFAKRICAHTATRLRDGQRLGFESPYFARCGVEIVIVSCQPERIPAEMEVGLSPPVRAATDEAARLIYERYLRDR